MQLILCIGFHTEVFEAFAVDFVQVVMTDLILCGHLVFPAPLVEIVGFSSVSIFFFFYLYVCNIPKSLDILDTLFYVLENFT